MYKLPEPVPFKVEAGHARADLRIPKSIPHPDEPLDIHAVSTGLVMQAIRFINDFFLIYTSDIRLRDCSPITGRGEGTKREGGQVKCYPYKRGGGR